MVRFPHLGTPLRRLEVAVRMGDTSTSDRAKIQRSPPDILITTPESLYLLLTSSQREILTSVDTTARDRRYRRVRYVDHDVGERHLSGGIVDGSGQRRFESARTCFLSQTDSCTACRPRRPRHLPPEELEASPALSTPESAS